MRDRNRRKKDSHESIWSGMGCNHGSLIKKQLLESGQNIIACGRNSLMLDTKSFEWFLVASEFLGSFVISKVQKSFVFEKAHWRVFKSQVFIEAIPGQDWSLGRDESKQKSLRMERPSDKFVHYFIVSGRHGSLCCERYDDPKWVWQCKRLVWTSSGKKSLHSGK